MATQIYFDGGLRPHPNGGYAVCYGWVMKHDSAKVADGRGLEKTELNVGSCAVEYSALIRAMELAIEMGAHLDDEVVIRGDSQVVISMVTGKSSAHADATARFLDRVKSLAFQFNSLRFEWIPRELNREADYLGRLAFAESDEIRRRVALINRVHIRSRRAFGVPYDAAVAEAWNEMVTGKKRFAQMCEGELLKMLQAVRDIPQFIAHVQAVIP